MPRERADILNAKKVLADVWPGQAQENSVALLKALHILTRDGALNQDASRRLVAGHESRHQGGVVGPNGIDHQGSHDSSRDATLPQMLRASYSREQAASRTATAIAAGGGGQNKQKFSHNRPILDHRQNI
jgi:hypothetical protein